MNKHHNNIMTTRWDIIDITKYAENIIDNCPNDITEIKIDGSILYSYYRMQLGNVNTIGQGLSYNYDEYSKYADEITKYMSIPDNDLEPESHNKKTHVIIFNQYYDWFWYGNNRLFGNIIIDLERFIHLETFHIYQIYIKKINHIPKTVKSLYCISCQIQTLSKLPKYITELNCSGNNLKTLPSLKFTKLQSLFANSNCLKKLPILPITLERLYCYDNTIKELPMLPPNLTVLSCANNNITQIDHVPHKLVGLYIECNYIKSLPPLPKTLVDLFVYNNRITKIPELPNFLKRITCHENPIREYAPFPPSVKYANIDGTVMQID